MPKSSRGITEVVSVRLAKIKRKASSIVAPLTARERLVYSVLALSFISLIVAPRIVADIGDEGSIFSVAATECSSSEAWLNPHLIAGQPTVEPDGLRMEFDESNSAVWQQIPGVIECGGFASYENHTNINNAFTISLIARNTSQTGEENLESLSEEEDVSQVARLQDGQVLSKRLEARSDLIEPNRFGDNQTIPDLDGLLELSVSDDSGKTWQPLHLFGKELKASQISTFNIAIPDKFLKRPSNLTFKAETIVDDKDTEILIDGMLWSYEVGAERELSAKLLDKTNKSARTEAVPSIADPSELLFEVSIKDPNDGFWQGLRTNATELVGSYDKQINAQASIINSEGFEVASQAVDTEYLDTDSSNRSTWEVDASIIPPSLDPGEYTLELRFDDGSGLTQTVSQDFLWGVLAINLDKASYQAGDEGVFNIAVLDENGRTICDAELRLSIFGPVSNYTLSTSEGTISVTPTCEDYSDHIDPDYIANQVFTDLGTYSYQLDATTQNGEYSISGSVEALDSPDYEISRTGPTRIFPLLDYPMEISVYSRDGYSGLIREMVPVDYEITPDFNNLSYDLISVIGNQQIIEWEVEIPSGESISIGYKFDAPDIAPEFYTLGPLEIGDAEDEIWQEQRSWQIAGDAIGNMLLFFDGATIPTGWTCVSCMTGDDFYQRFVRGASTAGSNGGSTTHTHTASGSVATTGAAAVGNGGNGTIAINNHSHTFTPTLNSPSNLPAYRQLKIIRHDSAGEPSTIPTGAIAIFDTTVPSGWTRYSAQDGNYIRGEGTAGTTGGSNTHTVSISGTTGAATGGNDRQRTGQTQVGVATSTHDHTVSGTSASANNEPAYREVILGELDSAAAPPNDMIAMFDDEPAIGWNSISGSGGALENRFIKPAATYGTTGGADTHNHSNTVITSGVPNQTTTSRTGTSATSSTHTHSVTVSGYSNENHLPPYRNVVFAKRAAVPTYEQSTYRWFNNDNSTDVGTPLAAEDAAATAPAQLTPFRLRMSLHVSVDDMTTSYENFKLQYAEEVGTCDTAFVGESYSDVGTSSGAIRFHDNSSPSDSTALTANANDPSHGSDTTRNQDYEEANNFTNSQAQVSVGEDGMWDFSLVDFSADGDTTYCFRVVKSGGTELSTYTVVPEITTAPPPPRMVLLYDGATIPSGWSCVSCSSGDEAYQRYLRGEATSTTGGSASHSHTASGTVGAGSANDGRNSAGTDLSENDHTHTYTPNIASANNLPAYRQLKVIKYDSGTPATIPGGAIGLFDAAVPAGFTRYSAQDGNYVRGEGTAGTTGGSNTHTNAITGSTGPATGGEDAFNGSQTQEDVSSAGHTHAVSGNTDSVNIEPPFIETFLGQANSDTTIPSSFIAMWDQDPGGTWTCVSCLAADPFYQRFFKPANGYGTTDGTSTHTHATANLTSGTGAFQQSRQGNALAADTHTHPITVNNFSTDNHLPQYIDYIFAKSASTNTAPNNPANLGQEKTDSSSLAVGNWTNESTVVFTADVSDPDNPDSLALCVEIQPLGTAFTNTETSCGSNVAYSGTAVAAEVSISSLTNGEEYHWQARVKDGVGAYSSWVSFGANLESARDVGIDTTSPTGTVYDGTVVSVDAEFNDGSLDTLSANWNIDSSPSGLVLYEYSIGTTPGSIDIKGWTSNGTTNSVTDSTLTLNTNQPYYLNVRTTDGAGSQSVISSDGQFVSPTLNFTLSTSSLDLGNLNAGNSYTSTGTTTLTTSTNAYNGYIIRGYATALLTNGGFNIGMFNGGTYVSPDAWLVGDIGYGYTSSDTSIQGANKFNGSPCAGGGSPPCYAPWSLTAPGDIIADHTSLVSGSPIVNEGFTITHRVTTDSSQQNGDYTTTIIYNITAIF
jgi:hypothetical protein